MHPGGSSHTLQEKIIMHKVYCHDYVMMLFTNTFLNGNEHEIWNLLYYNIPNTVLLKRLIYTVFQMYTGITDLFQSWSFLEFRSLATIIVTFKPGFHLIGLNV